NAPLISSTGGVASAVVFLRRVDPRHARPWNLPPATVELRQQRFHILQGDHSANIGFVRAGGSVELVSREPIFHSVQARGAAFFTRARPHPTAPPSCSSPSPGVVALTSGCGSFWMRASPLLDPHPYYPRPDTEGHFRLEGVPPGEYDLVAWHPSWVVVR